MEIGYKASKKLFARDQFGAWKYCDEDDLRRIVGDNPTPLKLAAMADAGKSDWQTDILPKEHSVLDMIRVAFYVHQIPEAVDMIKDAADKGYEVTANLMAVSTVTGDRSRPGAGGARRDAGQRAGGGRQLRLAVRRADRDAGEEVPGRTPRPTGKEVGIHAHNNQQLAFANTIEAIIHGANRVDATMAGLGRGAGNCPMELLIGFLRNPKFHIRPIYQVLQEHLLPLSRTGGMGPARAVQHHRPAQPAPPQRHGRPRPASSATTTSSSTTSW